MCECNIKTEFSSLSEIIENKNELLFNLIFIIHEISEVNSEINIGSTEINIESTEINIERTEINTGNIIINTSNKTEFNIGINSEIISNEHNNEQCSVENFFKYICLFNNTINEKMEIVNIIREELHKGNIDNLINNTILIKNEDLLRQQNGILYQITSTENQNNKEYLNISVINLKQCEFKLKSHYNITQNETLIIFKIDNIINEINIPIVEYEIYHPYTKDALDLNICKESPIEISYPVKINENEIYKYDPKNAYYNDKCFPYTTETGTDITLNDRKNEYNKKNFSLCENNCTFNKYNKDNKRTICECKPKTFIEELINLKINKDKLLQKFIDFKSTTNLDVIFCYKTFFCLNGIKTNIGSYILIIILIINGIGVGIFSKKGYKEIKNIILNLLENLKKNKTKRKKSNIINNNIYKNKNYKNKKVIKKNNSNINNKSNININKKKK